MILWYAAGGGLGHVTRAIAMLKSLPPGGREFRMLVTTRHAALAAPHAPCPVDCVPRTLDGTRPAYLSWLDGYLRSCRPEAVVLDTFPAGVVGEWNHLAPSLPRLLIARYIDLDRYVRKAGRFAPRAVRCLAIEEPHRLLAAYMGGNGMIDRIDIPVVDEDTLPSSAGTGWAVVHSGSDDETKRLETHARQMMREEGADGVPETVTPSRGVYPAAGILGRFGHVVTAAGYNSAAFSLFAPPGMQCHLAAFDRPFDDQRLRLERITRRIWARPARGGAAEAARWVDRMLGSVGS